MLIHIVVETKQRTKLECWWNTVHTPLKWEVKSQAIDLCKSANQDYSSHTARVVRK